MISLSQIVERVANDEGSTRPVALVRMAIPLMLWTRFAMDFALYARHDWVWDLIGIAFFVSTTMMFVGWRSRLAALFTAATMTVIELYLGAYLGHHHFVHHHVSLLLFCSVLLSLTSCGGSYSIDRYLAVRKAEREGDDAPPERGMLWAQYLLCLQLSAVYFWGAVDKMNVGFLSGERLQHFVLYFHLGSDYPDTAGFAELMMISAIGTVALEYALAVGLWFRRWQRWLIPTGIVFHLLTYYTLPVHTFSLTVILLYLMFIPADTVHAVIDRVSSSRQPSSRR